MASSSDERKRLEPETWRRIGAVLDRVDGVDLQRHPEALTEACSAEGVGVDAVRPYLNAERGSDQFLERLDAAVVDGALRDVAGNSGLPRVSPGERLGPYEIVAPVSAGGMGEVYEARDTRLGRTVAIKLLTRDLAADPEGRQRFEREARAISALNHPHVCTLYDVSEEDGTSFLVMELVQGETLAARLERGPLAIDDAIRHAREIADALAAAHAKGIVHRDLKPANIMLTARGVKLLDFGLAALRPGDASEAIGDPAVTAQGTVLGTPAYMAPEQVHGRQADARADIFALGAVMHEMLTGQRAFAADSAAGSIAAVLEREPEAISKFRPDVRDDLQWTIRTCLAKDAENRWQSAADVGKQLQWIAESAPRGKVGPSGTSSRRTLIWAAGAAVLAAVLTAAIVRSLPRAGTASPPQISRFAVYPPDGQTFDRMHALSPDGRRLAFVSADSKGSRSLWVRALDALAPQQLSGTNGAAYPFWSPDGRHLGFFADNALKKIELASGAVDTICSCMTGTGGGGTWNQDDVILFSKGLVVSPLWRVPASGGTPIAITPIAKKSEEMIDLTGTNSWPQFLPDGKHFLWLTGAQGAPGLYVGRLDSTERKRLLEFSPGLRGGGADRTRGWYASGQLFFVRGQALMAQRFSLEHLDVQGQPVRVVSEVEQTAPGRSFFDVAPGVLAYRPRRDDRATVRLTWVDRAGRAVGSLGDPGSYIGVAVSPDTRHVLAHAAGSGLVRIDSTSGIPTPLGLQGQSPVWAPDGARFIWSGGRGAPIPSIASLAKPEDFTPLASRLFGGQAWPTDWSPDGRYIVGQVLNAETLLDLWAIDVEAKPMTVKYLSRLPGNQQDQRISRDGRLVAYASNERTPGYEVHVREFPEGTRTWRVSTAGGRLPAWTADGRELLYVAPDGTLMRAAIIPGPEFKTSTPQPLFKHDALQRGFNRDQQFGRPYDVAGGRILLEVPISEPPPQPINVILHWEQLLSGTAAR